MTDTEQSIMETLAFFDLFDHPLTAYELFSWRQAGTDDSWHWWERALMDLCRSGSVFACDGYFALGDRPGLIAARRARCEWVARKMKRARRAAAIVRFVPFVRMVAVCNRLSAGHPHKTSDVDFLVVVEDGRLWIGRLLCTVLLQAFGLRRHGARVSDHACLSFFITPAAFDLSKVALDGDVYLAYWLINLLPLWSRGDTMRVFWQSNGWAVRLFVHAPRPVPLANAQTPAFVRGMERLLAGRVGRALERAARFLQMRRMKRRGLPGAASKGVVINDRMLKFHENDRREFYAEAWRQRKKAWGLV